MDISAKAKRRTLAARAHPAMGRPLSHDSALRHVCGTAVYVDDMREPQGTVHVAPGHAPSATLGRIQRLDLEAVKASIAEIHDQIELVQK